MIPKVIHYCWFGGKELPALEKRCRKSWDKFLQEYEIICWDESNFPFEKYKFAEEAYKAKKYAFVADVARLHALYNFGGIYLDTDIELLKSPEDLLNTPLFMGFETDNVIQTGIIGACGYNPIIKKMLKYYEDKKGFNQTTDGTIANSELFARMFKTMGIPLENRCYESKELKLYSSEFLCPINQATWEITTTSNSYCIHYLSGSWLPYKAIWSRKLKQWLGNTFGFEFVNKIRSIFR